MAEAPTPPETPEKKQRCPQLWLHPILQEAAERTPNASLKYLHRLDRFVQDESGVTALVTDLETGIELEVRSQYLIGCDGANSTVKKALGIESSGRLLSYSVNILIRAPGLVSQHPMGEAERYLFVQPEGTWANLTVVDGKDIWRLTILGSEDKLDLSKLDAEALVRRAFGTDEIGFEVLSVLPWRRSESLADVFSDGRVLLAGDAVHTMSPTGGMGMNTGVQDVLDLGWKVEAMLGGWGGPYLLDSYTAERRPIAARNIAFSSQNFAAWVDTPDPSKVCEDTEEGAASRKALGKRLRDSTKVEWESLGLQIGYRYENSPICIQDGTPPTADDYSIYVPTARPGSRAPHAWLVDGRSTLDLFGDGFTLLVFREPLLDTVKPILNAFEDREIPIRIYSIADREIEHLYGAPFVLVRPDGHVAWRGSHAPDAEILVDTLRGAVLARQTRENYSS